MVERRFSRFLEKLAFRGARALYQPLQRSESETLVSLGDRGRPTGAPTPPHPSLPRVRVRGLRSPGLWNEAVFSFCPSAPRRARAIPPAPGPPGQPILWI